MLYSVVLTKVLPKTGDIFTKTVESPEGLTLKACYRSAEIAERVRQNLDKCYGVTLAGRVYFAPLPEVKAKKSKAKPRVEVKSSKPKTQKIPEFKPQGEIQREVYNNLLNAGIPEVFTVKQDRDWLWLKFRDGKPSDETRDKIYRQLGWHYSSGRDACYHRCKVAARVSA